MKIDKHLLINGTSFLVNMYKVNLFWHIFYYDHIVKGVMPYEEDGMGYGKGIYHFHSLYIPILLWFADYAFRI
jgi:hypothetical protein